MNHLEGQKSPYLLQHASNPVDWYPWGEEAFQKARREGKPIFLSIGYSTCHWCHVMENESFSNAQVAALMNDVFVSIKVDREERPDLDEHFMTVSQMLTGGGGWPLTIVMTPDGKPFFAATYIPRENAYGRLGMIELVPRIGDAWKTRHAEILQSADSIFAEIGKAAQPSHTGFAMDAHALKTAAQAVGRTFDGTNGGFGTAPKFPMPTLFPLLLRSWKKDGDPESLAMVEQSLAAMRAGGIFDQVGFGFHRYSTDAGWRVPHFEKMLYDQALLALAYTEAWQATRKDLYRRTAGEIFSYVRRDLALPGGGFATAEDADSEGEEGKFYLWTAAELRSVLGDGAAADFGRRYGVSDVGSFPGAGSALGESILHRDPSDTSAPGALEAKLLAARGTRARPLRDDKVLSDWNGLMIAAMARAGSAFDDTELVRSAESAARFVLDRLRPGGERLLHRFRDGEAAIPAFADDYAFLSWGLLELYEATFDAKFLRESIGIVDEFAKHFWDAGSGGFFQTADDAPDALARRISLIDGVIPSANSVGLMVLLKLNRITGNVEYEKKAEAILRLYPPNAAANAQSFSFFLSAAAFSAGPTYEVVIAGDPEAPDTHAMLRALHQRFLPDAVVLLRGTNVASPEIVAVAPFASAHGALKGKATAYVCRDFVCNLPTNDVEAMLGALGVK